MKIIIATNKNLVHILLRPRLLATGGNHQEFHLPLKERSEEYLKLLTEVGQKLVKRIADIEGVESIRVWINTVGLEHSRTYEWENDLAELVMPIVYEVLGYNDPEKVTIEKTTMTKLCGW